MDRFVLNDALKTGVKMIDTHHQQLIDAINDLAELIETGNQGNGVKKILTFLQFYAEWHFEHEEKCAHKHECPMAEVNKQAHGKFLDTVTFYREKYRQDNIDQDSIAREIHGKLSQWLVDHIKGIDVKLGQEILSSSVA